MIRHRLTTALALAAAVIPAGVLASPTPIASPDLLEPERPRRQPRPSKCGRESRRGSRHCAPKSGTTYTDDARRAKADAKRNRKAARNLASVDRGPADTGRTP